MLKSVVFMGVYNPICKVIQGYSSNFSAMQSMFQAHHYRCIYLFKSKELLNKALEDENFFLTKNDEKNIILFDGDIEKAISTLKQCNACFILSIFDHSCYIAHQLGSLLGCPVNGSLLFELFPNKMLINRHLNKEGVATVRDYPCSSLDDLISLHKKIQSFPKILKPIDGHGSIGFCKCRNEQELLESFVTISEVLNSDSNQPHKISLQPYIDQDEYFINTMSMNGAHVICSLGKYLKDDSHHPGAKKGLEFSCRHLEKMDCIYDFIVKTLRSLEVRNTPAHIEFFLEANRPTFLEMSPRFMGLRIPMHFYRETIPYTQIDALIDVCVDGTRFMKHVKKTIKFGKEFKWINLISPIEGVLKINYYDSILMEIQSVVDVKWYYKSGQKVRKTVDDTGYLGYIILQHDRYDVIEEDYTYLCEKINEFFNVVPE